MNESPQQCPDCGSTRILEILYGLPTLEAFERSERGELMLGGCCIYPDSPDFFCKACHHEWRVAPVDDGDDDPFDDEDWSPPGE